MTQSKTYKSKIAARFGILLSRIKNKFNGSKLVAESYTLKYNTTTKEYTVVMNFMTEAEEKEFHAAIAEQQAKIMEMMIPTNVETVSPTLEQQKAKAEKWAADVEKNRQKQLADSKSKKKSAKKSVELSDEAAKEIVTEIKRRGVYSGEPTAKKQPKTPKVKDAASKNPKVKVTNVKNKIA
jgi:hypothetical protein